MAVKNPRCFSRKEGWKYAFDCVYSKKTYIKQGIFFAWLHRFDTYVGRAPGRRVVLFTDNCSVHEEPEYSPMLANVIVLFLVKNTTAELQLLDAGFIAKVYVTTQWNRTTS